MLISKISVDFQSLFYFISFHFICQLTYNFSQVEKKLKNNTKQNKTKQKQNREDTISIHTCKSKHGWMVIWKYTHPSLVKHKGQDTWPTTKDRRTLAGNAKQWQKVTFKVANLRAQQEQKPRGQSRGEGHAPATHQPFTFTSYAWLCCFIAPSS